MAVQYIPKNHSASLALPSVRRSARHLTLPPTPSTPTATPAPSTVGSNTDRVVARSPSTNSTRRRPRQSLATTTSPITPSATPTPASRTAADSISRSRKRSRPQDEPEDQREILASPHTPSSRTRLVTMFDNPITPEPTPRAIRAQKRRRLADEAGNPVNVEDPCFSSSSSPSLSPTTPHPQPISPEPASPTNLAVSAYIIKTPTRKRKSQLLEDDAASSGTSSGSDSPTLPSMGDPLPRSLTKRRKLDRSHSSKLSRPVRVRSKLQSPISTPTPLTSSKRRTSPISRSRARTSKTGASPLPRGNNNNNENDRNVRRSARLVVRTNESQQCYPSEAQLEESIPLSPLTPPPSDDDEPDVSTQLTDVQNVASSDTPEQEEDDTEMEMIACVTVPSSPHKSLSTSWKSLIPSHISNPILKGRPPPNPALYAQLQLASYRRTKPNTPSPLSLYSYTGGVTPPASPSLSAATSINSLDTIDDIPPLGEAAAAGAITAIVEGDAALVGLPAPAPEQLFHEQHQQQFYGQGYSQVDSSQQQSEQLFEQTLHRPQPEYQPSATAAPSPESSNPPHLVDMGFMMMEFQMQLQQMGMSGSAGGGIHFGVDQMGFMIGCNGVEERSEHQHMPATVHMQDVHLHQQTHREHQNQPIMDVQSNHQMYPQSYFWTERQGQMQQGSTLYETQEAIAYGGESQPFQPAYQHPAQQFQPQYRAEYPHPHPEQPQGQKSSCYEACGSMQSYAMGSAQVYEHQQHQAPSQQDFQAQQQQQGGDVTPPFSSSDANVGYVAVTYQTQTQTSSTVVTSASSSTNVAVAAPNLVPAATHIPHYTLTIHNALLCFQQSFSRFHEDQLLLAHDAAEMHTRQLAEFQREKEERKRRLKRTKLVTEIQVVPMGSSAGAVGGSSASGIGVGSSTAGKAKGLWAVACKARMLEVVKIYTPALIREVTEISARDYYRRMGLKYPSCRVAQSRYRRRTRRREDDISVSEDDTLGDRDREQEEGDAEREGDVFDGSSSVEKKDEADADEDGEEFRNEKIFDFELLDDDEEYDEDEEELEEVRQTGEDVDEMDDEHDEDDDDEYEGDDEAQGQADLDLEAVADPLFQPELSMRITPQEAMPSTTGGVETTFYVPPPEVYPVPEQKNVLYDEDQKQVPESQAQIASPSSSSTMPTTIGQNQKQKVILVHRPVLSLPPPCLSTFRPTVLKFYNIDPIHAGRGTPCVKERREMWAGGSLVSSFSFSVKDSRHVEADDGSRLTSSQAVVDDYEQRVTAWYDYADEVQMTTAKDEPSCTSSLAGSDSCSNGQSVPETDDSVFGDCVGVCCMNEIEDLKGKVEVGGDKGGEGKSQEELQKEEACGDETPSTSTVLPQQPTSVPSSSPLPPQNRQLTVEIPPAHSDRIPQGRRCVIGRADHLIVYAPPLRSVPPILPLARRPPRPPPPQVELGLDLDEPEGNSVVRPSATQARHSHHPPVVPYSWEQVAGAMEVLAYQGTDASVWVDGHGHSPPSTSSSNGISGTEVQVQPTFNPSSSELSAALG